MEQLTFGIFFDENTRKILREFAGHEAYEKSEPLCIRFPLDDEELHPDFIGKKVTAMVVAYRRDCQKECVFLEAYNASDSKLRKYLESLEEKVLVLSTRPDKHPADGEHTGQSTMFALPPFEIEGCVSAISIL